MRRTIVVGDVHGCAQEARQLLEACAFGRGDSVVFVGDLVGRGPDAKGVIDLVRSTNARSVLGNHEHAWLAWHRSVTTGEPPPSLGRTQARALLELNDEDWRLLGSLPLSIRLPEYEVIVVHAGLLPGVTLEKQKPEVLMNIRTVREDGGFSQEPLEGIPWGSCWQGPEHVIFGHHARRGLQRYPFATGIDTGCVYGGRLTACILPGRELVSVQARRAYRTVRG